MEAFNLLKTACTHKKTIKLKDLPLGEYLVKKFYLVQTRFGPKLKLELEGTIVFLPSSIAVGITDEAIVGLNSIPQIFIWGGYGESQFEP